MQDRYAASISSLVFNDLQDARTAKAMERFGIDVVSSTLRYVERLAKLVFNLFWMSGPLGRCPGIQQRLGHVPNRAKVPPAGPQKNDHSHRNYEMDSPRDAR